MKKIVISLSLIIAILASCTSVFAEKFEGIGMKINLPEEYYDLKAGIDTNDTKIEFYTALMKITKEDLATEYRQNSVLYNGINSNMANEIYVSTSENQLTKSIFHLSRATEEQTKQVKDELEKAAVAQGMKTNKQEVYSKNEITYIYTAMTKSSLTVYQYYTIVNGTGITISLHSSDNSAKKDELKKIVDSITFDELQEKPASFTKYILIGVTSMLVIMVLVLMYMAFFSKKNKDDDYEEIDDEE